VPLEHWAAQGG